MANNSIIDDIRNQFRHGNMTNRIILVNAFVFVFGLLLMIVVKGIMQQPALYDTIASYIFSMPIPILEFIKRPWTIFTFMFSHSGVFHFIFNMLWLYWFGQIYRIFYSNDSKILPIYIYGSVVGAITVLVIHQLLPHFIPGTAMLGASAGVMAVGFYCATTSPDYQMRLLFFGNVKLKYMLLVFVIFDLVGLASMDNTGGHIAHIAGGTMGWLMLSQLRKGNDLAAPFDRLWNRVTNVQSKQKRKPRAVHVSPKAKNMSKKPTVKTTSRATAAAKSDNTAAPSDTQSKIDAILDKIGASGYDSLTKDEKAFLFKIGDKKK